MSSMIAKKFSAALLLFALVATTAGCLKSPDEKYADYMASGQEYLEKGDYGAALIEFKNAARTKSTEAEPFYQIALCNDRRGQTQEAIVAVQQAVKLDPNHVEANLLLARYMVQMGGSDILPQAEELINGVLADERNNSEALFVLAATRARLGSAEDAENLLQEALRNTPEHLQSSMALARLKLNEGKPKEAEDILKKAVDSASSKSEAKIALGQFYLGQNRDADAQKEFEQILDADAKFGPALLGLGMLHLKKGEKDEAEAAYKRASALPGELYMPLYGQVLMLNGKEAEGIAEFERLVKEHPKDRALRTRLVTAYVQTDHLAEAEKLLDEVIAETPNDADARLQRAEVYRRTNRLPKAQEDLAAALEYRPNSHQAHFLLAKVYGELGDSRLQRQELDEALRINPEYLLARLELAQALLRGATATPQSAIDLLNEAPDSQRNTAPVVAARIWAHIALKQYTDARKELDKVTPDVRATNPEFLLQEGMLQSLAGSYAAARPYLEKSLEANPRDLRALNALAGTYAAENKQAVAIATVRDHAAKYPGDAQMQISLANWYIRAKYVDEAEKAYEAAVKAGDPSGDATVMLSRIYVERKELDRADKLLTKALETSPGNANLLLMRASVRDGLGKPDAAIDDYRMVVERNPENYVALNNLAYLLAARKSDLEEALKYAQQAKEIAPTVVQPGQPGVAEIDDTLGWVFYLRGVYASAVVHLRASAEANPKNPIVQYHLAMAHAKNGDVAAGRRALEAGLQIDPNLPEAAEARKILGSAN
ncbi:MAG: tetratricopeptide repeat protein [Bryobacterales bacterium]|nr:tetratricopeptide repeat protein [Bryobacterales bacterium]